MKWIIKPLLPISLIGFSMIGCVDEKNCDTFCKSKFYCDSTSFDCDKCKGSSFICSFDEFNKEIPFCLPVNFSC